jgi:hypothetical protein
MPPTPLFRNATLVAYSGHPHGPAAAASGSNPTATGIPHADATDSIHSVPTAAGAGADGGFGADGAKHHAKVVAVHTLFSPSANSSGYKLQLTLDVPSATTGTPSRLI